MTEPQNLKRFTFVNCICCGYKIQLLDLKAYVGIDEYMKHYSFEGNYNPESQMWDHGIVKKVSAGYGSSFDFDEYYIGICDNCIDINVKNGRLRYAGDYMSSDKVYAHYSDEELAEFERKRNRENNLNDLLG